MDFLIEGLGFSVAAKIISSVHVGVGKDRLYVFGGKLVCVGTNILILRLGRRREG